MRLRDLPLVVVLVLLGCGAGAPAERAAPTPAPVWRDEITGMELLLLPAGEVTLGSPADEPGREPQERLHRVRLTRPVYLGRHEVTQSEWRAVTGEGPSALADCPDCPVESVSWFAAVKLARTLSERSGERYRLPTEAEWEVACRAGTTTAFSTGDTLTPAEANIDGAGPAPVGSYPPNPWGFSDLHGNVWEWTLDDWCGYRDDEVAVDPLRECASGLKVIRGGSWLFGADSARCGLRYTHRPQDAGPSLGVRLVREIPEEGSRP